MSNDRNYMRAYMKRRYDERREMALRRLGGRCARCGSLHELEVDHVDPKQKSMKFDRMAAVGMTRFLAELKKCQLLCSRCHTKKTVVEDLGRQVRTHGTFTMYRHGKCRCSACKAANTEYSRKYRQRRVLMDRTSTG